MKITATTLPLSLFLSTVCVSAATAAPNGTPKSIIVPSMCPGPNCQVIAEPHKKGKRVVYLEFDGVTLKSSQYSDNAVANESAIVNSANEVIPPFEVNDLYDDGGMSRNQIINKAVADLKKMYADFNVEFVTERPESGTYHMIVFGGSCGTVAGQNGCGGIALGDCGDFMPSNIVFVFPWGLRAADLAPTAAQELAHGFGLGHTSDDEDIMYPVIQNYIPSKFSKINSPVPDGSGCGANSQNSYQRMMDTLGAAGEDYEGPEIKITSHTDGQTIAPGDVIRATVKDASAIKKVDLVVSGVELASKTKAPWEFEFPASAQTGDIVAVVRATDVFDNQNLARVTLFYPSGAETPCEGNAAEACGAGLECNGGICVPDNGVNELGESCVDNEECASESCGRVGDDARCTQSCSDESPCPNGFDCLGGAACWPSQDQSSDDKGSGCQSASGSSVWAIVVMLSLLGLALRRRHA